MKKGTKLLFIILGIIAIIVIWILIMWKTTGTVGFNKTPITGEEFTSTMKDNGLEIYDATSQLQKEYFESGFIAYNDDLQVEYYSLVDDNYAKQFYTSIVSSLRDESKDSIFELSTNKTVAFGNYATFTQTNDGKYYYISRIDNTIVCVGVNEEFKTNIDELMNKIKY